MYKIEIGVFTQTEERIRPFTPVFTDLVATDEELANKLAIFCGVPKINIDNILNGWISTEDKPVTFLMGGRDCTYGYQIYKTA